MTPRLPPMPGQVTLHLYFPYSIETSTAKSPACEEVGKRLLESDHHGSDGSVLSIAYCIRSRSASSDKIFSVDGVLIK
ncbi:hypothetical protein POX_b02987 [Penicillium oxalicum]|uniref:hypothetical protein n=1 Tax=Penicillium oxalicum TaxID=69781 RepID=UPI0020B7ADE3|nr:hypothetical protein POX_b02987 [Penicillium oxalicum]KAI2792943.1 hypothetical protein POX_b02987 [Penicillium oxalicum]